MIQDLVGFKFPIYFYCIVLAYYLFAFIVTAIVFNKVTIAEKVDNRYLVWIPFANIYIFMKMGKTKPILLLSAIGLIFPRLWIFFLAAFLVIVGNSIADVLRKFGLGTILIYVGVLVPFVGLIPLKELYVKACFNIQSNITINENKYSID